MIIFGYGLFLLYILNRIYNYVRYKRVSKKCREVEIKIEKNLRPPIMRDNQLVRVGSYSNEEFELFLHERSNFSDQWRNLYKKDHSLKRYGSLIIGLISLLLVVFNYSSNQEKVNLLLVMLPPLVTLFNTFFEKYEVTLPIKIQSLSDS